MHEVEKWLLTDYVFCSGILNWSQIYSQPIHPLSSQGHGLNIFLAQGGIKEFKFFPPPSPLHHCQKKQIKIWLTISVYTSAQRQSLQVNCSLVNTLKINESIWKGESNKSSKMYGGVIKQLYHKSYFSFSCPTNLPQCLNTGTDEMEHTQCQKQQKNVLFSL